MACTGRADAEPADPDLLEIAIRARLATICLTSALLHHDLTDVIPPAAEIALPVGAHRPRVTAVVTWHMFDRGTFHIGRLARVPSSRRSTTAAPYRGGVVECLASDDGSDPLV